MQYTKEQRELYPEFITVIRMKDSVPIIIDDSIRDSVLSDLNDKKTIRMDDYNRSLHQFDIDYIERVRTKDEHRMEIDKIARRRIEMQQERKHLSLNQSIQ